MDAPQLYAIVIEVLAAVTPYPAAAFQPTSRLSADLGIGSLEMIELATALEERLGITVDDSTFADVKTVADVVAAAGALLPQDRSA